MSRVLPVTSRGYLSKDSVLYVLLAIAVTPSKVRFLDEAQGTALPL